MSNIGLKIGVDGEREFKAQLTDINRSFKVLGSEMKLVASQFDKNDNSAKALTARNQVLNKEIESQKQKIEVLRSALENSATSFGENDKRTQEWQIKLNNAEAALNSMEREVSNNEKTIEDLSKAEDTAEKDTEELSDSIKESGKTANEAENKFSKFKDIVGTVAKATVAAVAAIGTAAVATGKAIWDMANETAQAGDHIDKTSQKIGISAQAYQEWDYVFQRCGSDVDNLQAGMKKLSGVITDAADGSDSAAKRLSAVGLSLEDLNGKSQEQQLSIVISALQNMESGAERTAAANALLGKSAVDMAAVLNMTAEETQALIDEANEYGMVMNNDAVAASAAFEDSLTKLQGTVGGLKNNIIGELLPSLTLVMDGLSDLVAGNEQAAYEIETGVAGLIESIAKMVPKAVSLVTMVASAVLESAPTIISALAEGILSALPTLMPVVVEIINKIVTSLINLLPQVVSAAMEIIASVASGIATALPTLVPTIVSVVTQIVKTIIDNLPMILNSALQIVEGLTTGILNAIPVLVAALPEIIDSIVTFLVGSMPKIIETGVKLLSALVKNLPTIIKAIVSALPQIITSMVTELKGGIGSFAEVGKNLLQGLWNGISDTVGWIKDKIKGLGNTILNTVKETLGIHSPSTVMRDQVGKNVALGIAEGIEKNADKAKKSAEEMSNDIVSAAEKKLDRMKTFNQISLKEEVAYWDEIRKHTKKGSDARLEANKKYYAAVSAYQAEQEKADKEQITNLKNKIQKLEVYNKISLEDEVKYWDELRKTFKKGSDERLEADKEYLAAKEKYQAEQKKLDDEQVTNLKNKIEKLKTYNKISLRDEVEYWDELRKTLKKGTDARYEADKQYLAAKEAYNSKLLSLENDYKNGVKKVNDELVSEIQKITDEYNKSVASRAEAITSSMRLFDEFKRDSAVSKDELTQNLSGQVEALQEWNDVLMQLEQREGMDGNLFDDLQKQGIASLETLKEINNMTDEELERYVELYRKKNEIAHDRALYENEDLKDYSAEQIAELINQAQSDMEELGKTYAKELENIGATVKDNAVDVGKTIAKSIKEGFTEEFSGDSAYMSDMVNGIVSALTLSESEKSGIYSASNNARYAVGGLTSDLTPAMFQGWFDSVISAIDSVSAVVNNTTNFDVSVNIANFYNNTNEDIDSLANKIMVATSNKLAREGVAFA